MNTTTVEQERIDEADRKARDAKREAKDATELVEALRERVRAGEDVGPAEIRSASDVAEHAALRATAADRQAAATVAEIRKAKIDALSAELAAHESDPEQFVSLLSDVEAALQRLAQAGAERAATVGRFRDAMHELGIPASSRNVAQDHGLPEHGGMAWQTPSAGGQGVAVNGRVLRPVEVGQFISAAVHRLSVEYQLRSGSGAALHYDVPDLRGPNGAHDLHAYLRSLA